MSWYSFQHQCFLSSRMTTFTPPSTQCPVSPALPITLQPHVSFPGPTAVLPSLHQLVTPAVDTCNTQTHRDIKRLTHKHVYIGTCANMYYTKSLHTEEYVHSGTQMYATSHEHATAMCTDLHTLTGPHSTRGHTHSWMPSLKLL